MDATLAAVDDRQCVTYRRATAADLPAITALLDAEGLPTIGVAEWVSRFWVAEPPASAGENEGALAGVAGVELYGDTALLRSVAVSPAWRGSGLGRLLTERALDEAKEGGAREVFLLTTTAEHYFPRVGFVCLARDEAPAALAASPEFCGACPASAVLMRRDIGESAAPAAGSR